MNPNRLFHSPGIGCLRFLVPVLLLLLAVLLCGSATAVTSNSSEHLNVSVVYGVGDVITLGGETNLAPGTTLLVTVEEAAFRTGRKGDVQAVSGISGTATVQEGTPRFWAFSFPTDGWTPGTYLSSVEAPETGITNSFTFILVAKEDMPDGSATPSPPIPPVTTPLPTAPPGPSPTAATPLPLVGIVAGCVIFGLIRSGIF